MTEQDRPVPSSVLGNINTVLELEKRAEYGDAKIWRLAHGFGNFVGSITFVAAHLVVFAGWIVLNLGHWPSLVFDPFPFTLLGTLVSCESVVLTTFVLIKQNREDQRATQRAHLDLQVNLLAEREITKVLQVVQRIADHVGVDTPDRRELNEMIAETAVTKLVEKLEDRSATMANAS